MGDPVQLRCPVCDRPTPEGLGFAVRGLWLARCARCGLLWQPHPSPTAPDYTDDRYYEHWPRDATGFPAGALKLRTFGRCVQSLLSEYEAGPQPPRLLDVGCAQGQMLEAARRRGIEGVGIEISPAVDEAIRRGFSVSRCTLEEAPFAPGTFDFVTMIDVLEHVPQPRPLVEAARRLLREGGLLLILTPDAGGVGARLLGSRWPHYKPEHLLYLTRRSLELLLQTCQLTPVRTGTAIKFLSIEYVLGDFRRYGQLPSVSRAAGAVRGVPAPLRRMAVPVPSDLAVLARASVAPG